MNTCKHTQTRDLRTRCFVGPVSRDDENRAAHGNVTVTVECLTCGAQRAENRNGSHQELGEWGPSRAELEQAYRAARAAIPAAPAPITMTRGTQAVSVRVDEEGMVIVSERLPRDDEKRLLAALPPAWLSAACARRLAVQRAASLEPGESRGSWTPSG